MSWIVAFAAAAVLLFAGLCAHNQITDGGTDPLCEIETESES